MTSFTAKYQLERDLRPFTSDEVRGVPRRQCGLYALWLPSGVEGGPERLYLGMSATCLRRRLLQHLWSETNPELKRQLRMFRDLVEFSVVYTESGEDARTLETALIRDWQPETNRTLRRKD